MAPGKKRTTARGAPKASALNKWLDAFLKDFEREVQNRMERRLRTAKTLKEGAESITKMEVLRLPLSLSTMKWPVFLALESSGKAVDFVISNDKEISAINQLAYSAIRTPFRTAKKAKQAIETINEEMEASLLPAVKKSRQEKQAAVDPEVAAQKPGKVQSSTKRPRNSKRTRPPSSRAKNLQKRLSKVNPTTPASQGIPTKAATPLFTPAGKFDSSIFRTPGLRAPGAHERVFSISVNGSPLADRNEVSLVVPLSRGENVRIRASELSERDLKGLSAQALGSVKKLSSQLEYFCSRLGSHK